MLRDVGLPDGTFDRTILLLAGDAVYMRSAAVLRSLRHLRSIGEVAIGSLIIIVGLRLHRLKMRQTCDAPEEAVLSRRALLGQSLLQHMI